MKILHKKIYLNLLLSYDYEIFFKDNISTCIESLIQPTYKILEIMNSHKVNSTFFIDAGYLLSMDRYKSINRIEKELNETIGQINAIERCGHEIGFHVHSHWEDTKWIDDNWKFDMKRFKLSDFHMNDAQKIFTKYYNHLNSLTKTDIKSFRAGGWCIEPFENIRQSMINCGITIDSTVYNGGKRKSETHYYDFTKYPKKDVWNFSIHPGIENEAGYFKEISISSMQIDALSYWKMTLMKIRDKMFATSNGNGISPPIKEIASNLFRSSKIPVSADSVKSEFLINEFIRKEKEGGEYFSVISHPKNMDKHSMKTLDQFIKYALDNGHNFYSTQEYHDILR